ncbi:hypothetical protein C474_10806 [Halogeometricum pallidum JCM 14848]|uniref:Uncharacterized protein n=1 Tax=Halogeometricum pallidum JCM 14848 TaxID=1227487 RepID=M0D622_HALPD|nr:hypothetical protein [Halogeometricum pallidum]ELZ30946.1 hypothetical protein C474_10806 [Halogeometricum pallidum JCM 14848]
MNRAGRLLVGGVGAVGAAGAFALVALPNALGDAAAALVAFAGNDYLLAAGVASVALLIVVAALALRGADGVTRTTPPEPETVQNAAHPGVEFDRAVEDGSWNSVGRDGDQETVRERVREAAVRSVMHREGVARERAAARVDAGDWTDDDVAAAFLSEDERTSLTARLLGPLSGPGFRRGAKRAADEVCRVEGVADERADVENGPRAATDGGRR